MDKEEFKKILDVKSDGRLRNRECTTLEFKANFQPKKIALYAKTIAAFANNKGGIIMFGVTDNPRKPEGMSDNNLEDYDSKDLSEFLNSYFSPEINFDIYTEQLNGKYFGCFVISESINKPVYCTKNKDNTLKECAIYYRYHGRSEQIKYSELHKILDEMKELESRKMTQHIENILRLKPQNISLLDLQKGNIEIEKDKRIVIDKTLLKNIKFIQEGKFVEKEGAPTLKLIGEIEGVKAYTQKFNLQDCFTTKKLASKLNLLSEKGSCYYFLAVVKEFKIQQKDDYFKFKDNQKYYTPLAYRFLKDQNITLKQAKEIAEKQKIMKKKH